MSAPSKGSVPPPTSGKKHTGHRHPQDSQRVGHRSHRKKGEHEGGKSPPALQTPKNDRDFRRSVSFKPSDNNSKETSSQEELKIKPSSKNKERTTSKRRKVLTVPSRSPNNDKEDNPPPSSNRSASRNGRRVVINNNTNSLDDNYLQSPKRLETRFSSSQEGMMGLNSPMGRTLTIQTKRAKILKSEASPVANTTLDSETARFMFDLFVTTLYGYLINRTINECSEEDVSQVFRDYLTSDLMIGNHCARAECIKENWRNFIFQNPPGLQKNSGNEAEDDKFVSTLLYISKAKGVRCEFSKCACRTTQGHLRITKSETGHLLEVFTLDTNYNEVKSNYTPIGFEQDNNF